MSGSGRVFTFRFGLGLGESGSFQLGSGGELAADQPPASRSPSRYVCIYVMLSICVNLNIYTYIYMYEHMYIYICIQI